MLIDTAPPKVRSSDTGTHQRWLRNALHAFVLLALTFLTHSTVSADEWISLNGPVFGTAYNIQALAKAGTKNDLEKQIETSFANIDRRMSNWRSDSDISRFNKLNSTEWFSVDLETAEIVGRAKSISGETDGMFDVTVAPLVELWDFGPQDGEKNTAQPTLAQIAEAMKMVGSDKIDVRFDPPALRKHHAGLQCDLSAIAKGHAVDEVASILGSNGIGDFMIEIGGEIRVAGNSPKGGPWRIGIESPDRGQRNVDSVVRLNGDALATSGDYRNFREIDGTVYTHVIDPKSGQSVHYDLASVTVIAEDCERADALATALLAMGHDRGKAWASQHGVSAMFLSRNAEEILHSYTGDFPTVEAKLDREPRSFTGEFLRLASIAGLIFGIAVIAMSIGTIFSNRRLTGSCGGLAAITDEEGKTVCELCSRPSPDCLGSPEETAKTSS